MVPLVLAALLATSGCAIDRRGAATGRIGMDGGGATRDGGSPDAADGTAPVCGECNDFIPCTRDECIAGECLHTGDATMCTAAPGGTCDLAMGCRYPTGTCPGGCGDANPCTLDECIFEGCMHTPIEGPCDDGDPCTVSDECDGKTASCQPGSARDCGGSGCECSTSDGLCRWGGNPDSPEC